MGFFDSAPYSAKNLIKGTLMARQNGEPWAAYRYAVALQEAEDAAMNRAPEVRLANLSDRDISIIASNAMQKWYSDKKPSLQYIDSGCKILVRSGFHKKTNQVITDILIFDRERSDGAHWHIGIDDKGRFLFKDWNVH